VNNFVYAADTNYNKQLFYSINSLLNNTKTNLSLHIIHKEPETFEKYAELLENNYSNFSINIYKFDFLDIEFPNIENKHVSEATYYRLFIEKIIPNNIENYIYLDADIIAINNFDKYTNEIMTKLNDSDYVIACRTEYVSNKKKADFFDNLQISSSKYFNAGVMFVDHKKWLKENIGDLLLNKLNEIKNKINYWDQDVLNSYFNGKYIELNDSINYPLNLRWPVPFDEIGEEKLFIHYQSNNKPWNIRGCFNEGSKFYQNVSLETEGKHHLVKTVRRYDLYFLIIKTLQLQFRNIDKKLNFYKEAFKIIFL
tara:strand:- start:2390 stop:3322 length:933 start_codon:yes stop_codon:yes gene_type:complete